mmetsp:Transcript_6281/g.11588  ORF Transcript_6281/g.11588 Transcript_6281/m.11588 type:complete len:272 (-) Transcript_6281:318-1133(-)
MIVSIQSLRRLSLLSTALALVFCCLSLGGANNKRFAWGYGKMETDSSVDCNMKYFIGLHVYTIEASGTCSSEQLGAFAGSVNDGWFSDISTCNDNFWGIASNALCRSCATVGDAILTMMGAAAALLLGIFSCSLYRVVFSKSGENLEFIIRGGAFTAGTMAMHSLAIWVVGCQNQLASYLDTTGQQSPWIGHVTNQDHHIRQGTYFTILTTIFAYFAGAIELRIHHRSSDNQKNHSSACSETADGKPTGNPKAEPEVENTCEGDVADVIVV